MTIEIFTESRHAKFHEEEFFAFCMEIKFLWNQNFGGGCVWHIPAGGLFEPNRGESGRKWDGQSGFKKWGGSANGWKWPEAKIGSTCLSVHRVSLVKRVSLQGVSSLAMSREYLSKGYQGRQGLLRREIVCDQPTFRLLCSTATQNVSETQIAIDLNNCQLQG